MSEIDLHNLDEVSAEVKRLQEETISLQRAAGENNVTPAILDIWVHRRELARELLSVHSSVPENPDNDFVLVLQLAGFLINGNPREQKVIANRIEEMRRESMRRWDAVDDR